MKIYMNKKGNWLRYPLTIFDYLTEEFVIFYLHIKVWQANRSVVGYLMVC